MAAKKETNELVEQALAEALHSYMVSRQALSPDFMEIFARKIVNVMEPMVRYYVEKEVRVREHARDRERLIKEDPFRSYGGGSRDPYRV